MAISITVKYYRSEIITGLQSYDLRVVAESATDMSKKIFVFQRMVPIPPIPATPDDRFTCLADPVDLEEIPEDAPDLDNEMPYFRVDEVTLRFRDMTTLEEVKNLIDEDVQRLVDSLKAAANVALTETKIYG